MSTYSTLIDDALNRARGRSPQGLKLANAEAPAADAALKIADALEYAAYTLSNDGTPAGDVRAELVRNFFKEAAEGGAPASGATEVTGTQAEAPRAGRTKIPVSAPADAPKVTESPDGKMSREVLAQTPSKDPSKSAGQTLWDVLMKAKEAEGPRVMDAADAAPSHPTGQEGGAQANAALANNEAPVSATRRELHEPTRKRVAEVFESAADTGASQAAAKIVAPKASASGNLKNASFTEIVGAMRKEAYDQAEYLRLDTPEHVQAHWDANASPEQQDIYRDGVARRLLLPTGVGALGGAALGGLAGHYLGARPGHADAALGALRGAGIGGLAGLLTGSEHQEGQEQGFERQNLKQLAGARPDFQVGARPGFGGSILGAGLGAGVGGGLGALLGHGSFEDEMLGATAGSALGGALGGTVGGLPGLIGSHQGIQKAHSHNDRKAPAPAKESSAPSILELAQGWDAAYTGQFGDQVKAAAAGIVDSLAGARTP